jgi:bile acid:Na+ symporter, BASS family
MSPALGVTMLGMGLTLTFDDIRRVLAAPRRIFAGFVLQYTIMPALAFGLSRLAALPLDFAVGLCIVGSCPGGTASNVVTYLAGADVPLSVAMTTASTLGAVVATPLLTKLLLGTLVPVDAMALLMSTLQVVLLPVLLGAALNQSFPRQVERLAPLSALSAVLLVATICGSVISQNASAVMGVGPRLLGAIVALHAGGFALGYVLSKALGLPERAARTNSIEVGMQNSALGALLAATHFPVNALAPVPCAISACTHSVLGSLLAAFWRSKPVVDEASVAIDTVRADEADEATRRSQVQRWIADWRARTGVTGGS